MGNILYMSPSMKVLSGYGPHEMEGEVYEHSIVHPDDRARLATHLRSFASDPQAPPVAALEPLRLRRRHRDGSWVPLEVRAVRSGPLVYTCGRNVAALDAAERAVRDLLLSSSFALRAHAQNIAAAASLLAALPCVAADAEAQFLAGAVTSSCSLLLGIESNMVSLHALERGELALRCEAFSPAATVRDVVQACTLGRRHVSGDSGTPAPLLWVNQAEAEAALPALVEGDAGRIAQILVNLCSNALKFGQGKAVRVRVALEREAPAVAPPATSQPPRCVLRADVEDAGPGLSPQDCERFFRPYEHAPPEMGGGTGLGLHVCRLFAEAMGGSVTVRSVLGHGCTFSMRVPVRVVSARRIGSTPMPPMADLFAPQAPQPQPQLRASPATAAAAPPVATPPPTPLPPAPPLPAVAVSAPRSAEETEAMEARLLEAMLAHSRDAFLCFRVDADGGMAIGDGASAVVEYASAGAACALGWAPAALLGRRWAELVHPDDAARVLASAAAAAAGGPASAAALYRLRRQDGAYAWVHGGFCGAQQRGACLTMLRSAAGHKSRQEALRGFLRVTSHDLRTPCHGIAVACALLRERPGPAADADAAALADACAAGCALTLAVVNNVLAVADVDAGGGGEAARAAAARAAPPPQAGSVPLPRAQLADVMRTCRLGCGASPSALRWADGEGTDDEDEASDSSGASGCGELVAVDAERFAQIALNLLVYALHDRDADAPPVEAALRVGPRELALTLRHVSGGGAEASAGAESSLEALFSATGSCAGLGLHVARFCARAAGGDVAAALERGGGGAPSTLSLRAVLPTRRAAAAPPPPPPSPTPSGSPKRPRPQLPLAAASHASTTCGEALTVVVVEDHELNRRLVCRLLQRHGFAVRAACPDGAAALRLLTAPGAPPPDLVLTDMSMPVMGGAELARALRAWEAGAGAGEARHGRDPEAGPPRRGMYVAALTAGVLECEEGRWEQCGLDACLSKPLRPEALAALAAAVERRRRGED